ncbi:MAG: hypothetical protein ACTSXA_06445 [Candidatus Heimdallarchaeota archaeon]
MSLDASPVRPKSPYSTVFLNGRPYHETLREVSQGEEGKTSHRNTKR